MLPPDKAARRMFRQEVEELTSLLRQDPKWEDVRVALRTKKLLPEQILLATFHEDEEDGEYGVVVTPHGEVFEYKRSTRAGARVGFIEWHDRTRSRACRRDNPGVVEALAMLSSAKG